jgi:hypothetical protein
MYIIKRMYFTIYWKYAVSLLSLTGMLKRVEEIPFRTYVEEKYWAVRSSPHPLW